MPAIKSLVDQKFLTESGEAITSYVEQSMPNYFNNPTDNQYNTLISDIETNLPKFAQHLLDNWESVLEEQAQTYLTSQVSIFEFYIGMTSLVNRIYKYFLYAGYAADFAQKEVSETKAKLQDGLESLTNWNENNISVNKPSIDFVSGVYQLEEGQEYASDVVPSYTPDSEGAQLAFVQAWWFTEGYDVTINHRPFMPLGGQYSANNWQPDTLAPFVVKKPSGWSVSNSQVELYTGVYDIENKQISGGPSTYYPIRLTDGEYVLSESTDNSWTFICNKGPDNFGGETYGCFHLKNHSKNKFVKMPIQKKFGDPSQTVHFPTPTPTGLKENAISYVHKYTASLTSSSNGLHPMYWFS